MAELLVKTGLKLWLKGDGFRPTAWNDSSGSQVVGAFTPSGTPSLIYPTSGLPPYVTLRGAADFFTGPAPGSVMSASHSTIFAAFYANTAAATSASPWLDNAIYHGTAAADPVMSVGTVSSVVKLLANIQDSVPTNHPLSLSINLGQWYVAWMGWDSTKFYLGIDPINFQSVGAPAAAGWSGSLLVGRQYNSTAFFDGNVGELLAYNVFLAESDRSTVFNYLSSRWEGRGDPLEMLRDVGSRRLWALGQPRMHIVAKDVPISYPLPATLLDDTRESFFSHPRGIDPAGGGWPEGKDWQPRPGRIEQVTFDFDALKAEIRAADLRPFRHVLLDGGVGVASGVRREGQMAGSAGAVRVYSSDVIAQYLNPADGVSTFQALPDEERPTAYGLSNHANQNYLLRSAFISGTTGLTLAGTGVNGSAIALDTTKTIFGTDVQPTPQSLKFTAGSPHTSDLKSTWPASAAFDNSATAAGPIWLAIIHGGNGAPAVQVQRSTDSKWLQDTSGNWGVSAVWVSVPAPGAPFPSMVSIIALGTPAAAGTSTYTLTFGLPSGGTAGRTHNVYYCALTDFGAPAANGILNVTDASALVASFESLYQIQLNSVVGGAIDAQTIAMVLRPSFTNCLHGTSQPNLLASISTVPITGAVAWELRFDGSGNLAWRASVGGGTFYTAQAAFSPTIAVPIRIVCRRTSSHGEFGLTPYTLSIFVNGVKGTDAVESTHPVDSNIIYFPGSGCALSKLIASPYAWSDAECAAWGL